MGFDDALVDNIGIEVRNKVNKAKFDKIPPEEKIVQLIFAHLEVMKEAVYRNGNLRAEFFRDVWKVEAVRKDFDKNEINLFRRIMNEGIDKGVFEIRNVRLMAEITHYCLKGCEVPYIYGRYAAQDVGEL